MKKILISTLPLGTNYGGIMQAYALQSVLLSIGFEVETTSSKGMAYKRAAKSIPGLMYLHSIIKGNPGKQHAYRIDGYTQQFVEKYIKTVDFDTALFRSMTGKYFAYVVGSDQVWRNAYVYIPHSLFSYAPRGIKISYAASFGRDDLLEYNERLISKTSKLARKFIAISVREDSGVDIVKKYWNRNAEHHVDPTILVNREEYEKLIANDSNTSESSGDAFIYVLDKSLISQGIVKKIVRLRQLRPFSVIKNDGNDGDPMAPVTQWLRSFRDAEFIITDSFHGTVFSIIFNKPFIAIGNKERGLARFSSILKIFGLEDRLVSSIDEITLELLNAKISWDKVNKIRARERVKSFNYLKKHLGVVDE